MIICVCSEKGSRPLISGGFTASLDLGTMVKSKREAMRIKRRMRRGWPATVVVSSHFSPFFRPLAMHSSRVTQTKKMQER